MPHVITDKCVMDKYCVDVCPVGAISCGDDSKQCFINPDECLDCGACISVCQVEAIFPEDEVPAEHQDSIAKNAEYYK